MNETTAFMVISLMTNSRVGWDERMYRYPPAEAQVPDEATLTHLPGHVSVPVPTIGGNAACVENTSHGEIAPRVQ